MNHMAVALAADSAVTVNHSSGQKVYNTTNKLFMLSAWHPIGVMVYGSAQFMDVPWESVIKTYRRKLDRRAFGTTEEYARSFLEFLEKDPTACPAEAERRYFAQNIFELFMSIKGGVDTAVEAKIKADSSIDVAAVRAIARDVVAEELEKWERSESVPNVGPDHAENATAENIDTINRIAAEVFEEQLLSEDSVAALRRIAGLTTCRKRFPKSCSGIVIAGFGENETFPALREFTIESRLNGVLKWKEGKLVNIDCAMRAAIVPFAQAEMVCTFMEGIDPLYKSFISGFLDQVFEQYPAELIQAIPELSDERKEEITKRLHDAGGALNSDLRQKLQEYQNKVHVSPITEAVAALPMDELAAMAESLVNLTSFKQKVSMNAETVGGPIDVAVISKGDGFVWIKRKHYFRAGLNPQFFTRYGTCPIRVQLVGDEDRN